MSVYIIYKKNKCSFYFTLPIQLCLEHNLFFNILRYTFSLSFSICYLSVSTSIALSKIFFREHFFRGERHVFFHEVADVISVAMPNLNPRVQDSPVAQFESGLASFRKL